MAFDLIICYTGRKSGELILNFSHVKLPLYMKLFYKHPPAVPHCANVVMVRGSEAPV